jgi:hypothetical protein
MPGNNTTPNATSHIPAEVLSATASLTDLEVARLLSCSTSALRNARSFKKGPLKDLAYFKIGRSVRYAPKDVLEFQQRFRIEPNTMNAA